LHNLLSISLIIFCSVVILNFATAQVLPSSNGSVFPQYAFAEVQRGYDYSIEELGNNSYKKTIGLSPFIYDENSNSFVEYLAIVNQNNIIVQTEHGSVKLWNDCTFDYYNNGLIKNPVYADFEENTILYYENEFPLFKDSISARMSNVDVDDFSPVNSVNNESCLIDWNGSELVATKEKTGVGKLEYKYILNNGKWKTQLEATNLSSLENKKFGFYQTIDLYRDSINYGGNQKNLDNFDGQTFDRTWLENNEGKVIDLMNGFYFDFDLGFDNLDSVTVYDTGNNKSQLVFDFKTTDALLPNETLVIDPTFGSIQVTHSRVYDESGIADNDCRDSSLIKTTGVERIRLKSNLDATTPTCDLIAWEFPVENIPDNADVIQVNLDFDVTAGSSPLACDFMPMDLNPSTANALDLWNDIINGTDYVSGNTDCQTIANGYSVTLGATANNDLESALTGDDTFSVGAKFDQAYNTGIRDATSRKMDFDNVGITVTYNLSPDPPKRLTGGISTSYPFPLSYSWLEPENNGATITSYSAQWYNSTSSAWQDDCSATYPTLTCASTLSVLDMSSTEKFRAKATNSIGDSCYQFAIQSNLTDNLVLHLPLCYTLNDSGTLGNDFVIQTGNELYENVSNEVGFNFDEATVIEGINESDYDLILDADKSYTIAMWVKSTNTGHDGLFFKGTSSLSNSFYTFIDTDGSIDRVSFFMGSGSGDRLSIDYENIDIRDGTWQFLTFVNDGSNSPEGMNFYLNSVNQTGSINLNDSPIGTITNNVEITISDQVNGVSGREMLGQIRHVMLFDTNLSQHDIENLYNEQLDILDYEGSGNSIDQAMPIKRWIATMGASPASVDDAFGLEIGIAGLVMLFGVGLASKNIIYGSVLFAVILGFTLFFGIVTVPTSIVSTIIFFVILIIFSAKKPSLN